MNQKHVPSICFTELYHYGFTPVNSLNQKHTPQIYFIFIRELTSQCLNATQDLELANITHESVLNNNNNNNNNNSNDINKNNNSNNNN